MTAPTPVQGEGHAGSAPTAVRPTVEGPAEPGAAPEAGHGEEATAGEVRRGPALLLADRRLIAAAAATAVVVLAAVLLLVTGGSDDDGESVTAGEGPGTTVSLDDAALPSLPKPERGETAPTAVPLPVVPGPPPTPSTVPPTTEAPTTTGAPPATRPVTTAPPEEMTPATVPPPAPEPAPAPPTTVPPPPATEPPTTAPPTTVAPQPSPVQVASQGGTVVVVCSDNRVALQGATPAPGFRTDVDSDGPKEVKVNFRGDGQVSRINVKCKDGVAQPRVRDAERD